MTLLKNDGTAPTSAISHKMNITAWPIERLSEGVGLSIKDGWNFGFGFGLAVMLAVPFVLLMFSLFVLIILAIFGNIG